METAAAVINQDNVAKEYSKKDAISEVAAPKPSVGKETAPTNEQVVPHFEDNFSTRGKRIKYHIVIFSLIQET